MTGAHRALSVVVASREQLAVLEACGARGHRRRPRSTRSTGSSSGPRRRATSTRSSRPPAPTFLRRPALHPRRRRRLRILVQQAAAALFAPAPPTQRSAAAMPALLYSSRPRRSLDTTSGASGPATSAWRLRGGRGRAPRRPRPADRLGAGGRPRRRSQRPSRRRNPRASSATASSPRARAHAGGYMVRPWSSSAGQR